MSIKKLIENKEEIEFVEKEIQRRRTTLFDWNFVIFFLFVSSPILVSIPLAFFKIIEIKYAFYSIIGYIPIVLLLSYIYEKIYDLYIKKKVKTKEQKLATKYFRYLSKSKVEFVKKHENILNKFFIEEDSFKNKLINEIEKSDTKTILKNQKVIEKYILNLKENSEKQELIELIETKLLKKRITKEEQLKYIFNTKNIIKSI